MANIVIAAATAADYDDVLLLNEEAVPAVNSIPVSRLSELHQQSLYLGVARDGQGALAGFLLVLAETARYDSVNFSYFKRHYDRFAYVDRIVVSAEHRRAGVGLALYQDLLRAVPPQCPMIACEVNVRPPNPTSLAFHQRLGFKAVGEQDTEGGSKRVCLMVKTLP